VEPRDRLLARIAALREADGALRQPGLRGQYAVVDLLPPGRRAGLDPEPLELLGGDRDVEVCIQDLRGRLAVVVRRDPVGGAEDDV
jgi:hypothetical protein